MALVTCVKGRPTERLRCRAKPAPAKRAPPNVHHPKVHNGLQVKKSKRESQEISQHKNSLRTRHTQRCVHSIYFATNNDRHRSAQDNIRNVAVIAHVDHGKTTLADALLLKAGLLSRDRAGDQNKGRSLDTLKDEKERGITIQSTAVTLEYTVRQSVLNSRGPYYENGAVPKREEEIKTDSL